MVIEVGLTDNLQPKVKIDLNVIRDKMWTNLVKCFSYHHNTKPRHLKIMN